jgi:hypothetical protein
MNRFVPALALIGLVALLLASRQTTDGAELLVNGGFESGTSGWSWNINRIELTTVASPIRSGSSAGHVLGYAFESSQRIQQRIAVEPGANYTFSGWILADDPNIDSITIRIAWHTDSDSPISFVQQPEPLIGQHASFRPVSTPLATAPPNSGYAQVEVRVQRSGAFDIYLDDFSFDGPLVTPPPSAVPSPSATLAPTPVPTATDATTPATTIAPTPTATPQPTASPVIEPSVFEQLTNGGFEETRDDGSPYAWRKFGGAFEMVTTYSYQGSTSVRFSSNTTSTKWLHQTIAVSGAEYYEASGYALKYDPNVRDVFLRLSFYTSDDGLGPAIDTADSLETLSSDDPNFRRLSTGAMQTPPDARTARLRLMLRPSSNAPAEAYFDGVSFVRVPEPIDMLTDPSPAPGTTTDADAGRPTQTSTSSLRGAEEGDDGAGTGTSATPAPPVALAADSTPASLANVGPSSAPATIGSPDTGHNDRDWLIVLALALPAIGLATVGFRELHRSLTKRQ